MLYEEQSIQKHIINVLKLLNVYNATSKHYSLWTYVFLFKRLNVFNLSAATKNYTYYTFFFN